MRKRNPKARFDVLLRQVKKEIPKLEGCKRCGMCCGPLRCTPLEVEKIKKYLTHNKYWTRLKKIYDAHKILERATEITPCYLLEVEKDGTTSCLIYPVRPIVCRLQGLKSNLRCPHNPEQNIKMTKNMHDYYTEILKAGVVLNDEIEKLLLDEIFMKKVK